jgi:hypothetical protein
MNRAFKNISDVTPASQNPQSQPNTLAAITKAAPNNPVHNIRLRSSLGGLVLEQILQSHSESWEHWGLNE